jgi:hypothetical protein
MPFGGDPMTRPVSWTEPRLFEGGYELLTVKLRCHLDGPRNELCYGWSIEETRTGSWVAADVRTLPQGLGDHVGVFGALTAALKGAYEVLTPF